MQTSLRIENTTIQINKFVGNAKDFKELLERILAPFPDNMEIDAKLTIKIREAKDGD